MQNALVILAIDTSIGPCSVAVLKDGVIAAAKTETASGKQSSLLIPMIEEALEDAQLGYHNIAAVACTLGPGGFTGIRVGLATARAIALAAEKPLIGVSTLETIGWGAAVRGDVLAVIDAYRGQLYVQRFRKNGGLISQSDALLLDAKALAAISHGAKVIQTPPHARDAATLAADKWNRGEREFSNMPLYIREPDAKPPSTESLKCAGESL